MYLTAIVLSFLSGYSWLIFIALLLLLAVQIRAILTRKNLSKAQVRVKLTLNVLLWLVLMLFAIQPTWTSSAGSDQLLVVSDEVPAAVAGKVKDSLSIPVSMSYGTFKRKINKGAVHAGSFYFLGQEADPEIISGLSSQRVTWLPYFEADQLQDIRWKTVLRRGEVQEVSGKMALSEPGTLRIRYAGKVLDSVALQKGFNAFSMSFPAFAAGRTTAELELHEKAIQSVRFYTVNRPPLSVLFLLDNPDFESKTLAEWLGYQGYRVEMSTQVAKNTLNKTSINKSAGAFVPDIIITDAGNAAHARVKKAVSEGKSVFFSGLTEPGSELNAINIALGTRWKAKKISNEEFVAAGKELTALPYQLEPQLNQKTVTGYPVAVQKTTGKVGVSLLNETFSLKLSGDSVTYNKIWAGILQHLTPAFDNNVVLEGPVLKDALTSVRINHPAGSAEKLYAGNDTILLKKSAVNPLSHDTEVRFSQTGWQPFQDSLEVYVEDGPAARAKLMAEAVLAHADRETGSEASAAGKITSEVPDWVWLVVVLLLLTALWVEPKLGY